MQALRERGETACKTRPFGAYRLDKTRRFGAYRLGSYDRSVGAQIVTKLEYARGGTKDAVRCLLLLNGGTAYITTPFGAYRSPFGASAFGASDLSR